MKTRKRTVSTKMGRVDNLRKGGQRKCWLRFDSWNPLYPLSPTRSDPQYKARSKPLGLGVAQTQRKKKKIILSEGQREGLRPYL